jgi:hypothetical protein
VLRAPERRQSGPKTHDGNAPYETQAGATLEQQSPGEPPAPDLASAFHAGLIVGALATAAAAVGGVGTGIDALAAAADSGDGLGISGPCVGRARRAIRLTITALWKATTAEG